MGAQAEMLVASDEVVRIIEGRLSGREYPFGLLDRICIGHALANDMVLRGRGTRDIMVELRRNGEGMVLKVLRGRADLLGRPMEEGEEAVLPPYLPFRLGEFVLAHGYAASDRWEDAARAAASSQIVPQGVHPTPQLTDRLFRLGRERIEGVDRRFGLPRLALAGLSLVTVGVAAGAIWSDLEARSAAPPAFEEVLREYGLQGLSVTSSAAGGLIVSGVLVDEAQMEALHRVAETAHMPVTLDVRMATGLASAATDILLAQGLDAEAQVNPTASGALTIHAPYLAADRQQELGDLLMRDLPGLTRVDFTIDDSRGGDPLQSFFSASGAGLATLVEDPPHIVTADGARWFPGSLLPTGHHLIAIENGIVRFEKDGRVEELQL